MELRQLRYFLAVARHLNFTRAAAEVHIAQPPLSRQIANLEAELGVTLLERSGRGLKLTPAGTLFEERASEILERIERARRDVIAFGVKEKRPFRFGFDSALLYGRTPQVLRFLRDRYPDFDFQYAEVPSAEQARMLRNGQIELALGRALVNDAEIEQLRIRDDPLLFALVPDHPACGALDRSLPLASMRSETLILYGERTSASRRDPILRLLDHVEFRPADTIWVRELSAALGLVAAGIGFSIVPGAATLMRDQDVCYVGIAEEGATCPVVLSRMTGRHADVIDAILLETRRLRDIDAGSAPARESRSGQPIASAVPE